MGVEYRGALAGQRPVEPIREMALRAEAPAAALERADGAPQAVARDGQGLGELAGGEVHGRGGLRARAPGEEDQRQGARGCLVKPGEDGRDPGLRVGWIHRTCRCKGRRAKRGLLHGAEHTPPSSLKVKYLKGTQLRGNGGDVADYANDVLVDTQWVEDHLSDDSIRIVEVDENPALYAEAHIPGAIGFDWKKDLQDQVKRDFLGPEDFAKLFGGAGVSNDHTVVLYGDRNNWFAAYTFWYLKYYGHNNVKLVNGPREKWIAEGRPTTSEVPSHEAQQFTAKEGDAAIRAHRDEVLDALDSTTALVDVRSPQEFSGELIAMAGYEQEGAQRAGHIPGAASVPWAQAVQEDGTFKSADDLRELYSSKGVINGGPVIAYCRIGERSAHTWFVLHELLGEQDVKNYDGSWTEWGNMVAVPIEKDV